MSLSPISFDNAMKAHKKSVQQEKVYKWIARRKACIVLTQMLGDDIEQ